MTVADPTLLSKRQPSPLEPATPGSSDDGFSLSKLLLVVRRRSLWFGITFGVVFASVGLITIAEWLTRPQYRGGFRMLVRDPLAERTQQSPTELAALAKVDTSVDVPTLIEVLSSPMLLDPLAKRLGLRSGDLVGRVMVGQSSRDSNVLTVNLLWGNSDKGTMIVEALANEYLEYSLRQRKEKLTQGLKFLDEQAPGLQQRVLDLQQQLALFRRTHTMLAPEEQSRTLEASRAELLSELRGLKQTEAQLEGLLSMVRSGRLVSPFQGTSTPVSVGESSNPAGNIQSSFSPLLNELVDVEAQLAQAQSIYSPDSPLVRNLRARRDRLKPLLQRRELDAIHSALQVNRFQQQKVNDQVIALAAEFRRNPELIKSYEALQQRLAVARENLGSYLKARETFRLEVAQSTVPWQVITPPQFGVLPVEPNFQSRFILGLALAVASGTVVAYLRDRSDRVFHSTRELQQLIGLPLLGTVPFLPVPTEGPFSEWSKDLEPEEVFALRESLRGFYQSLRTLRANRTLRVIAITSSAAGEGKTTTSALLGQALVDMGMKVLLVDADLRRARLHQRLGLDNARGWSELFSATPPSLVDLYQWVGPNLAVLTAGPQVPDPARLLSSVRCGEIVDQIRGESEFDLILFDTPPALELVDPLLISEHMDGLLLLVSVGRINRDLPMQVVQKAYSSNVDLLGIVANQRVETLASGAHGYGYGYSHGYGSSSRYGYAYGYGYVSAPDNRSSDEASGGSTQFQSTQGVGLIGSLRRIVSAVSNTTTTSDKRATAQSNSASRDVTDNNTTQP